MNLTSVAAVREWGEFFGIAMPGGILSAENAAIERYIGIASRDLERHLGAVYDPALLLPEQVAALSEAVAVQACYLMAQGVEALIGADDGLASVGPLSFSLKTPGRLSPMAAEQVAGAGLYAKSGTVDPDPVDGEDVSA